VVSIKNNTKVSLPSGDKTLQMDDIITLIGKIQNITRIFAELNNQSHTLEFNISKSKKRISKMKLEKKPDKKKKVSKK
jgi:uncharacterized transporter YbjL